MPDSGPGRTHNIAASLGDPGPPPNALFVGPTQFLTQNNITASSAAFVGLTVVSNRQTGTHKDHGTLVRSASLHSLHVIWSDKLLYVCVLLILSVC